MATWCTIRSPSRSGRIRIKEARLYTRPETRVDASRWILQNVPGPVNLNLRVNGDNPSTYQQLLSISGGATVTPGQPYYLPFTSRSRSTPPM